MLSGYRATNTPHLMNRYDYIVFGIENYYLRFTSVFDRCLRLANVIYQFGLPDRQCNSNTIIKNTHIKGTPVATTLKKLDKFIGPFRSHRNTVAHKTTYSEKELDSLGSYYLLTEKDDSFDHYKHLYKKKTDDFVLDKKTEYKVHISEIETLVKAYFNSIQQVFSNRIKSYV